LIGKEGRDTSFLELIMILLSKGKAFGSIGASKISEPSLK
jgi:hypothetical protein